MIIKERHNHKEASGSVTIIEGPGKFHNHEVCRNHKGAGSVTIIKRHRKYDNHKEAQEVSQS